MSNPQIFLLLNYNSKPAPVFYYQPDRYVKTAGKMKEQMTDKEKNGMYEIEVTLEKFYFDEDDEDGSYDENSDTYKLLVEQLNRMKQKVRGKLQHSVIESLFLFRNFYTYPSIYVILLTVVICLGT